MKDKTNRTICVVGLGYIGLPTAALLANRNYKVHGVDVRQDVVDIINRGDIHIVEPDLDTYVRSAVNSGNLKCATTPEAADVFIIAVPTPFHEGYVPNVDYITSAAKAIAPYVKKGSIVVLESTSPVGATLDMQKVLEENGVDVGKIYVAHCPERVLPGQIMKELVENDRIVGGTTTEATKATAEFYREFVTGEVLETDSKTAEMAKLTENSFRDVNIAFANELSMLCDKFGIDVWDLIRLANHHPRVNILNPGVGVGGHCIAVDPWFIIHKGQEDAKIIKAAREVNLHKTAWVVEQIKSAVKSFSSQENRQPKVACLGLAYKPDIDDLRESPSLEITRELIKADLDIVAVEPNIKKYDGINVVAFDDAVKESDIVVILVPHKEFNNVNHKNILNFASKMQ